MKSPLHIASVTIKNERGETLETLPSAARFRNYSDALEAAREQGHEPVDVWEDGPNLVVIAAGGRPQPRKAN